MFPTISYLLEYLFGVPINLPIPTFGVFVVLAFVLSYFTFYSEFKRKERVGVIATFEQPFFNNGATAADYAEYGLLGFLLGFKVIGACFDLDLFWQSPLKYIFSLQGSWLAGTLICLLFSYLIYWYRKQEMLENNRKTTIVVHPYQLMPKLMIWTAVWGFLGAKVFNFLENVQLYSSYSFAHYLQYSGLTFLGGLTFGAMTYLYIGHKSGMRLIDLADIGSPGMMVAYGVGRIACQLSGDGDWGIVNNTEKPFLWLPDWMWSFRFPYNVLNEGSYISGCAGNYCTILPHGVFPTSFYESVLILTAFFIIWINRNRIRLPGLMFSIYLLVIGLERLLIEEIRLNYRYEVFGMHLSQAQMVSLLFILLGLLIGGYTVVHRKRAPW
ncbi:hypothetical protein PBAL39_18834 [Pedobacter sp. BAL39]|uniref:prolipoprotein diacylglyceryl transferase family protein n=1 Tax=Pedobacter sp. BAL39 TaxID=391596 RepID=UPI000155990F|nr:prolipoprotein diacylglyceryl transferase family protein [Pedobacter sp. BAL39]EDM36959.1 hypothetical protein PBAL39_18834 [Pedobacter sp. BAL39]